MAMVRSLRARGFTLLEMIVTLFIVAILAAFATPQLSGVLHRNSVSSASNTLLADLAYARSEAVTRNTNVSICPTTTGTSCSTTKAYESGWLVYTYTPGHAVVGVAYDSTKADNVILRWTKARSGVSIQASDDKVITFGQQGQLRPDAASVEFYTCYLPTGSDEEVGSSTAKVPGSDLKLANSGSATTSRLGVMSACTPG
jgi:type IV fimbrial biogenesis protein FimT